MCERETFSGYVLLIYNKVFFAGSSSVIGHPSPSDAARIVHDYNGLVCCKYKKRSVTTPNKHTYFSREIFPEPIKNVWNRKAFSASRKNFGVNMKSFIAQREKTPEIGKVSHPESTPENTHGLSQKIQGTYFKISALYFKIYGLYFSRFYKAEKQ